MVLVVTKTHIFHPTMILIYSPARFRNYGPTKFGCQILTQRTETAHWLSMLLIYEIKRIHDEYVLSRELVHSTPCFSSNFCHHGSRDTAVDPSNQT
jgi:hypothetical protein